MALAGCVLGIDGGATSTKAVILDGAGNELASGTAKGSNPHLFGFAEAGRQIVEAARAAALECDLGLTYFDAACFGLAGLGRQRDRAQMKEVLKSHCLAAALLVEHDASIALYGALDGEPGIIVLAGTGAMAYGMTATGQTARANGRGRLLGDEGGGYELAVSALKAVCRAADGRAAKTALTERIHEATGSDDIERLTSWVYAEDRTPSELAALATVVLDVADAGDEVARDLVACGAQELAQSVRAVAQTLWDQGEEAAVSYGGSLLCEEPRYRAAVNDTLKECLPEVSLRAPQYSPVLGAARKALQNASRG